MFCRRETKNDLSRYTAALTKRYDGFRPSLVIVQVGDRDDSNVYIKQKIKSAAEVGVKAEHVRYPETITQNEVCGARCSPWRNDLITFYSIILYLYRIIFILLYRVRIIPIVLCPTVAGRNPQI